MRRFILPLFLLFQSVAIYAQSPLISKISPSAGKVGDVITITGQGFSKSYSDNSVYFGTIKAIVQSGNTTELQVKVPSGLDYQRITVVNNLSGLTARSSAWFGYSLTYPKNTVDSADFQVKKTIALSALSSATLSDIDGDGRLDIVGISSEPAIVICLNTTSAPGAAVTFASPFKIHVPVIPEALSVQDLNGDGRPDLGCYLPNNGGLTVFQNQSSPGASNPLSFYPGVNYTVPKDSHYLDFADIDGDGKIDIVATQASGSVTLLLNKSTKSSIAGNSFSTSFTLPLSFQTAGVVARDLDQDGKQDLIISDNIGSRFSVIRNITTTIGSPQFDTPIIFSSGVNISQAVDADQDGKVDLIGYDAGNRQMVVLKNNSKPGTMAFSKILMKANSKVPVFILDLNGDGKPDLMADQLFYLNTANADELNEKGFTGYELKPSFKAAGDINNDGNVDLIYFPNKDSLSIYTYKPQVFLGPWIFDFSPLKAGPEQTVTITGGNFDKGVSSVSFGNVKAISFKVISATQIEAVVGADSGNGVVSIASSNGTATQPGFIYDDTPIIKSIDKTSAGYNTVVNISGYNLGTTTLVKFGSTAAPLFNIASSKNISAVVGQGSSGIVTVFTPAGLAYWKDFVYLTGPPVIESFRANPVSSYGDVVTIRGHDLAPITGVYFGGHAASYFYDNGDGTVTTKVGNGASGDIMITNALGKATYPGFVFTTNAQIISVTPSKAIKGDEISITGSNLSGVTAVSLGTIPAASFTIQSDSLITAIVGAGQSGDVSITSPTGLFQQPGFDYIDQPAITDFSPKTAAAGTQLSINGYFPNDVTGVSIGGIPVGSYQVVSNRLITATINESAVSGIIEIQTTKGTIVYNGNGYVQVYPIPKIIAVTPLSATDGQIITIQGSGFSRVKTVTLGGINTPIYSQSPTLITAKVGSGASGDIAVTAGGGVASFKGFSYLNIPILYNFAPNIAVAGATITIIGKYLKTTQTVSFGGVPAQSFTILADTMIKAVVAPGSLNGKVTLTSGDGSVSEDGFNFISKPSIIASGPTTFARGDQVVLNTAYNPLYSYEWYNHGLGFTDNHTNSLLVTQSGAYSVKIISGDIEVQSNSLSVNVLYNLPADNFLISSTNVSCKGMNNGSIDIQTKLDLDYILTIKGPGISETYPFSYQMHIDDLPPGAYHLCFGVNGDSDISSCFDVIITEPKDLALYALTKEKNVILQLSGGNTYYVDLNGKRYETSNQNITLPLINGGNRIVVTSDKPCQGTVEQLINISGNSAPYPNPFNDVLYIALGEDAVTSARVDIYNLANGQQLFTAPFNNQAGVISIDVSKLKKGIYSLHLIKNNTTTTFKITK